MITLRQGLVTVLLFDWFYRYPMDMFVSFQSINQAHNVGQRQQSCTCVDEWFYVLRKHFISVIKLWTKKKIKVRIVIFLSPIH